MERECYFCGKRIRHEGWSLTAANALWFHIVLVHAEEGEGELSSGQGNTTEECISILTALIQDRLHGVAK